MYSVHQHWDPLKVCVIGKSYPPEYYSWIKNTKLRSIFEQIAIETEEDFQQIINKLKTFGVEVLRPDCLTFDHWNGELIEPPPMTPRDSMVMIGNTFYNHYQDFDFKTFYNNVKDPLWPNCESMQEFNLLPADIQQECIEVHKINTFLKNNYSGIFDRIKEQNNTIKNYQHSTITGSMVSRIGQDLYFGTNTYHDDQIGLLKEINSELPNYRNHIVNTGGHSDGVYCPVCPGLIISSTDIDNFDQTYPGWEVVYFDRQYWDKNKKMAYLKEKNKGRWWLPGFEHNQDFIELVETYFQHWTGYVEETIFEINMLIIDPKNVMVLNYNKKIEDVLNQHGINMHVVPFRHRYFWDSGLHCMSADLHREGAMQDYFPERGQP